MKYSLQCVGGPHDGRVIDTSVEPKHGKTVSVAPWSLSSVHDAEFFDANHPIDSPSHPYTFVRFDENNSTLWVLAESASGISAIRHLLNRNPPSLTHTTQRR